MKISVHGQFSLPIKQLMRKAGYTEFLDPNTGELSYVCKLTKGYYPRFHAYIDMAEGFFNINLHLDQKKPSYGSETAHSGEYRGEVVETESRRIEAWINSFRR